MATKQEIQDVWDKGRRVRGKNPDVYRKDTEGNEIYRTSYGKDTDMGWEIDHIDPRARGGGDNMENLQPLQTKANRIKSDNV
ncbi:MAG: HNH endonuclease [Proteobacteria bacterium]|nr:HNH endonuclease [Pseudomonadota bacterium]